MRVNSESDRNGILLRGKNTKACLLAPHLQNKGHLGKQKEDGCQQAKKKTLIKI